MLPEETIDLINKILSQLQEAIAIKNWNMVKEKIDTLKLYRKSLNLEQSTQILKAATQLILASGALYENYFQPFYVKDNRLIKEYLQLGRACIELGNRLENENATKDLQSYNQTFGQALFFYQQALISGHPDHRQSVIGRINHLFRTVWTFYLTICIKWELKYLEEELNALESVRRPTSIDIEQGNIGAILSYPKNLAQQLLALNQKLSFYNVEMTNKAYLVIGEALTNYCRMLDSELSRAAQRNLSACKDAIEQFLQVLEQLLQVQQFELAKNIREMLRSTISEYRRIILPIDENAIRIFDCKLVNIDSQILSPQRNVIAASAPNIPISNWQQHRQDIQSYREIFNGLTNDEAYRAAISNYSDNIRKFLTSCAESVVVRLGPAPCGFGLLGTGSITRKELLPYSDLDCVLIIENPAYRAHPYFVAFIMLFKLELDLLGEPHGLHIEDKDINSILSKESLDTVDGYLDRYNPNDRSEGHSGFVGTEAYALYRAMMIYADSGGESTSVENFQDQLRKKLQEKLDQTVVGSAGSSQKTYQSLALKNLQEHSKEYRDVSRDDATAVKSKVIDVKERYCKPLLFWLLDVGLYFGIIEPNTQRLLQILKEKKHLSPEIIEECQNALTKILRIRSRLHLSYGYQNDKATLPNLTETASDASGILAAQAEPLQPLTLIELQELELQELEAIDTQVIKPCMRATEQLLQRPDLPLDFDPILRDYHEFIDGRQSEEITIKQILENLAKRLARQAQDINIPQQTYLEYFSSCPRQWQPTFLEYIRNNSPSLPNTAELLTRLRHYPKADGWRVATFEQRKWWRSLLSQLFISDELALDTVGKDPHSIVVYTENIDEETTADPKKYFLRSEVAKALFTNPDSTESPQFKSKPEGQRGRHTLLPVDIEEGKYRYWFKIFPEQPGIEYAISRLAERISPDGVPPTAIFALQRNLSAPDAPRFAVQIFPHVEGVTLDAALNDSQYQDKQFLKNIDSRSFTYTLLRVLLTNPEDDKGDDYYLVPASDRENKYFLVRIDNERAFFQPDEKSGIFGWKRQLLVKSILYCLNEMKNPLDIEVLEDFLLLDPHILLRSWLEDLIKQQTLLPKIFSLQDVEKHFTRSYRSNQQIDASLLSIHLGSELMQHCLNRILWIQGCIRMQRRMGLRSIGMELLEVQKELAYYYCPAFEKHPIDPEKPELAEKRFTFLTGDICKSDTKSDTKSKPEKTKPVRESQFSAVAAASKSAGLPQQLSLSDVIASYNGIALSPKQAQKNLRILSNELMRKAGNSRLDIIADHLAKGNANPFRELKIGRHQALVFKYLCEKISGEPHAYSKESQQKILKGIIGVPFIKLTLSAFRETLTLYLFPRILTGTSQSLCSLNISGCNQLSLAAVLSGCIKAPHLKYLDITGVQESGVSRKLPTLNNIKVLRKKGVDNLQFLASFPALEILDLSGCLLTSIKAIDNSFQFASTLQCLLLDDCPNLETVIITAPNLREVSVNSCRKLINLQIISEHLEVLKVDQCESLLSRELFKIAPYLVELKPSSWDKSAIDIFVAALKTAYQKTKIEKGALLPTAIKKEMVTFINIHLPIIPAIIPSIRLIINNKLTELKLTKITEQLWYEPKTLRGHRDCVRRLAVLPSGHLASGSDDHTIKIWEVPQGVCVKTLTGHRGWVRSLAVLPSGHLASGSDDKTIKIWDVGAALAIQKVVLRALKDNRSVSELDLRGVILDAESWEIVAEVLSVNHAITTLNQDGQSPEDQVCEQKIHAALRGNRELNQTQGIAKKSDPSVAVESDQNAQAYLAEILTKSLCNILQPLVANPTLASAAAPADLSFSSSSSSARFFASRSSSRQTKTGIQELSTTASAPTLAELVLEPVPVVKDGHCFYRAVAFGLKYGKDVQVLRVLVADKLEANFEQYREFITLPTGRTLEDYIADIRGANTWAGDLEQTLLMKVLNQPIVIIDPDSNILNRDAVIEAQQVPTADDPIFVYFDGINHYDALKVGADARAVLNRLLFWQQAHHADAAIDTNAASSAAASTKSS